MQTWPRDIEIERSSMSRMKDVIGIVAYLENIPMAVTIGGGIVIKGHVITKQTMRDVRLSGSS